MITACNSKVLSLSLSGHAALALLPSAIVLKLRHRSQVELEFNCLQSDVVCKAAGYRLACKTLCTTWVVPLRQVALVQLYKQTNKLPPLKRQCGEPQASLKAASLATSQSGQWISYDLHPPRCIVGYDNKVNGWDLNLSTIFFFTTSDEM